MGFFNRSEITSIQDGTFVKDSLFDSRIIADLSDVILSPTSISYNCTRTNGRKKRKARRKRRPRRTTRRYSCCTRCSYYKAFSQAIECNNETSTLFADCLNATSLVFSFKYINYTSLTYNCQLQQNGKCVSNCTKLASSDYSLQMFQLIDNQVQSTWTGTSDCNTNVNKLVPIDTTIKYCPPEIQSSSLANELNYFTLVAFLLGILF